MVPYSSIHRFRAPITETDGGFLAWEGYGWCPTLSIPLIGAPITETDGGGLPFLGLMTFPFLFFIWIAPGALPRSARWRSCSYVNFI